LEKVTLIKDITCPDPLRAHVDILYDLSLDALYHEFYFHNFSGLHQAWEKRLDTSELNKLFYREVANWYFWALGSPDVTLPRSIEAISDSIEREKQRSIFFIRLLTRLIFCWFLQEKRLLPRDLFRRRVADRMLKDAHPKAGTYYRAFLQNLFFATLNQEQDKREWRKKYKGSRDGNRGVTNLWRYSDMVKSSDDLESLLRNHIPFINGGLFDCLDDVRDDKSRPNLRLDDFSEERDNGLCLPNELFFAEEQEADLSAVYDDQRRKKEKVRGLIETLSRYKFTVEENTPFEEEIALDPELLGKVFENLLASYNEDTRTTARKALGAFYTPREIVRYMVDEALMTYLTKQLPPLQERSLKTLFSAQADLSGLTREDRAALVSAIGRVKILDPACGSGAFPMGALQRLVDLLQKLDENNESWKRDRLSEAEKYYELLCQADAPIEELEECKARIEDIRRSFDTRFHALDFARKLFLIENCIYGVDVQPIACQIAKLRFFIALLVDQKVDLQAPNLGVRPLPNLETKIVAADALVPMEKPQMHLIEAEIRPLRRELEKVRHDHFNARTPGRKAKCREDDARLRQQIADLLKQSMPAESAQALAKWDPYDQNHAAEFFDAEWMFGLPVGKVRLNGNAAATLRGRFTFMNEISGQMEFVESREVESGFDIVLGNPPYVRIQTLKQQNPELVAFYKNHYKSAEKGNYDLYVVFVEAGLRYLKPSGQLAYILPHKFFNAQYGESLRGLLTKGRHLRHVVHFGDQQVFPGATNYVCLLFLDKAGADNCRFVRVDDFDAWLHGVRGTEGNFPASAISSSEWNFTVGPGRSVFERLVSMSHKLGHIARIWQGVVTSADKLYVVEALEETQQGTVRVSTRDGTEWLLEASMARPLINDIGLDPFGVATPSHRIIVPYRFESGAHYLVSESEFRKRYPETWKYLKAYETELRSRESGRADSPQWYGYLYPKNLALFDSAKLVVQVISQSPRFTFDPIGVFFTGGGNGPYYGIRWLHAGEQRSLHFLQALLNSPVSEYFIRQVSTPFRGGYWSYGKRFIEQIPIAASESKQEALIVKMVEDLLYLNRSLNERGHTKSPRDTLMLEYWRQILNGLVYELYFPEELHAHGIRLFDVALQAYLPPLRSIPDAQRMSGLGELFQSLYASNHPVRGALFSLGSLESVRIVEGRK